MVNSTLELEGPEHKAAVVEASSAIEGIGDGFVAVLPESMFSKATLERLSSIGLLSGVLILEGFEGETQDEESVPTRGDFIEAFTTTARESLYSPDVTTPQVIIFARVRPSSYVQELATGPKCFENPRPTHIGRG